MTHIKHIGILLIGFILPFSLVLCSPSDVISVPIAQKEYTYDYSTIELETMSLINDYRVSMGLNKLEINNYLSIKCEEHNTHMLLNDTPCHDDFTSRSADIMRTIADVTTVHENVAYHYHSAKSVLAAWLASPTHKRAIELPNLTHFGISIRAHEGSDKLFYTNIFIEIKK